MAKEIDINFLKGIQREVEKDTAGFSSPAEAILALRKKENLAQELEKNAGMFSPKVVFPNDPQNPVPPSSAPKSSPASTVFYKGHRYSGDAFSCIIVSLIELNNPKVNEVFKAWGFKLNDLDGEQVFPPAKSKKKK